MKVPLPATEAIARRAESVGLGPEETARFSRHILLPEVGTLGQRRLKAAKVLVLGAGGLGSPVSLYLAAAGVGTIGLVDFDTIDTSNLQRQILFREADQGRPKLEAAEARLRALSSKSKLELHDTRLNADNVEKILAPYDVIIDGTDNFPTRYLVNDACVFLGKPYVYGSIFRFDGQASVFYAPHGPCYRCLFPSPPPPGQAPSCAEGGVLGVLPGLVGTIQATEALKLILGTGDSLLGRLLTIDALSMRFDEFRMRRDEGCPVCGKSPTITTLALSASSCALPSQEGTKVGDLISVEDLKAWRDTRKPHALIDVRGANEALICSIEGASLIPLGELETRKNELPRDIPVVLHCKSGPRSLRALEQLKQAGFTQVLSLGGGILAWIDKVDPSLSRY